MTEINLGVRPTSYMDVKKGSDAVTRGLVTLKFDSNVRTSAKGSKTLWTEVIQNNVTTEKIWFDGALVPGKETPEGYFIPSEIQCNISDSISKVPIFTFPQLEKSKPESKKK
jgi:hypothetical protein